jgi:hypothetical protein
MNTKEKRKCNIKTFYFCLSGNNSGLHIKLLTKRQDKIKFCGGKIKNSPFFSSILWKNKNPKVDFTA